MNGQNLNADVLLYYNTELRKKEVTVRENLRKVHDKNYVELNVLAEKLWLLSNLLVDREDEDSWKLAKRLQRAALIVQECAWDIYDEKRGMI